MNIDEDDVLPDVPPLPPDRPGLSAADDPSSPGEALPAPPVTPMDSTLAAAPPDRRADIIRAAHRSGIQEGDPAWGIVEIAISTARAAEQAQQAADRATEALARSVEILRASAAAVDDSCAAIPAALREGAQRAGDDVRAVIALAGRDTVADARTAVSAAVEQAAAGAAKEIVRQAAPGLVRAASGGGKSRWMAAGVAMLLAGAGGLYAVGRASGRITPSYLAVRRMSSGWDIWSWSGAPGGATLPGGRDGCPRGAWVCTSRYSVRRR
jgi:hypothetical protein